MKLSEIAALLGLDEIDAVRPVPLTDAELATAKPRPRNRAQRREGERRQRKQRSVRNKAQVKG